MFFITSLLKVFLKEKYFRQRVSGAKNLTSTIYSRPKSIRPLQTYNPGFIPDEYNEAC